MAKASSACGIIVGVGVCYMRWHFSVITECETDTGEPRAQLSVELRDGWAQGQVRQAQPEHRHL